MPFEVPSSWEWTTLGELFTLQAGKNITAKDISDKEGYEHRFPCYGGNGLRGYVCSYNRNGRFPLIGRQGALCGNINLADGLFYATEHAVVVETYCETDVDWAVYTLTHLNLNQYATSTAQPGLSVSTINEVSIPLPPIEEQRRIVSCLNKWFALIDPIEHGKVDLQTTIKQAKSKILDLAIHGKLVPQDPTDQPAFELLKRINPKAEITCDNGQYGKMPNGWIVSSYKNIVKNISSKPFQILQSEINDKGSYPVISQSCNYIEGFTDSAEKLFLSQESIIFGDHTRNVKYLNFPFGVGADGVKILQTEACCKYIYYFTIFAANNFIQDKGYSRHYGQLSSISVAIPPLAEQHRIVAKIEELFSSLDNIQKALEV